jgi:undecaprenyl-diphosphatase
VSTEPNLKPATRIGWLALYPAIGIALFILGSLLFGAVTIAWQTSPAVVAFDHSVDQTLHDQALSEPRPLVNVLDTTSFWIGKHVLVILSIGLGAIFVLRKRWREFWMLALGVGGAGTLWYFLSNYFGRSRPTFPVNLNTITVPSYPSGHSASSLVFYGLMAYLIVPHLSSRFLKVVVIVLSVFLWLFVGFGRLFVGGHYPTDVLGGYALGLAWGALVVTLVEWYFARRSARKAENAIEDSSQFAKG